MENSGTTNTFSKNQWVLTTLLDSDFNRFDKIKIKWEPFWIISIKRIVHARWFMIRYWVNAHPALRAKELAVTLGQFNKILHQPGNTKIGLELSSPTLIITGTMLNKKIEWVVEDINKNANKTLNRDR